MRTPYRILITLIIFTACDYHPIRVVQGGIANLPKLPPEEKCLNTLKSLRPKTSFTRTDTNIMGDAFHKISWKDTIFLANQTVSEEIYFGTFHNAAGKGSCEWQGVLDSLELYFGNHHQTILIPNGAVYLRRNQGPKIKMIGNDSTIIQGFKITFDGFSGATGNMAYEYYLFDRKTNRYNRDSLLSRLPSSHIDFERGVVTSGWNGGHVGMIGGRTMYKLTQNGRLEFLKTWHSKPEDEGYRVTHIKMENNQKVTWSVLVTSDEWRDAVWY